MLTEAIDTYLRVRRACGFKLCDDECSLNSFARFATARGEIHVVADTAITWAKQASKEQQRARRLQTVIRFARFSRLTDSNHEIPPEGVFCTSAQRPAPYLFTDTQIQALMDHAAQLGPHGSLRPETYTTLIGLLAATGLRVSEALGLRLPDFTADGLMIRETKFRKTRLLPLHDTTRAALERYRAKRCRLATLDDHLFVSHRYGALKYGTVYQTFIRLLSAAGLCGQPGQPQPRLLDFRHTFASNALQSCSGARSDTDRHMLALMTYLGHAHPSSTYWYLERSPQLMSDIARACERLLEEHTS